MSEACRLLGGGGSTAAEHQRSGRFLVPERLQPFLQGQHPDDAAGLSQRPPIKTGPAQGRSRGRVIAGQLSGKAGLGARPCLPPLAGDGGDAGGIHPGRQCQCPWRGVAHHDLLAHREADRRAGGDIRRGADVGAVATRLHDPLVAGFIEAGEDAGRNGETQLFAGPRCQLPRLGKGLELDKRFLKLDLGGRSHRPGPPPCLPRRRCW